VIVVKHYDKRLFDAIQLVDQVAGQQIGRYLGAGVEEGRISLPAPGAGTCNASQQVGEKNGRVAVPSSSVSQP